MANTDKPKGFSPVGETLRCRPYTAGAAVYPGDAVKLQADGKVDPATASQSIIGVAASYAAADGDEVLVWDDPNQLFKVQDDGVSATLSQTSVGLNYNIVATAGNSTYKDSRMELDADSGATDSTLPLRLVGFAREEGESGAGAINAKCIVAINQHQLGDAIEGA